MLDDQEYQSEWDLKLNDFDTDIEMSEAKKHKAPVVFPDIKTCLETMTMISKMTPHLEAMKKSEKTKEEKENIIKNYHYTEKEKEYLLYQLYENKNK